MGRFLAARMESSRMRGCRVTPGERRRTGPFTSDPDPPYADEGQDPQGAAVGALLLSSRREILHRSWEGPKPNSKE